MITIPDEVKDHKRCSVRTINQHDFVQGLVGMKDPVKRTCGVKPLGERETYGDTKRALDSGNDVVQADESWSVPERSVPKDQVERAIGNLLADFCSDSEVYMLKREPAVNRYGGVQERNRNKIKRHAVIKFKKIRNKEF
ncbi:uncharacterized protein LOC121386371 isoform X2 [Gigantopelta aegis]|uniref:uncharacterized protein LOC121386371 isoform X2 n=1 Tax=Gigantopelta aegis TaxID=1735272 RepID=UPI001B888329|nr:uncharacterized protein LOC121386371 isoform X2 [Gigantopelta aegis]